MKICAAALAVAASLCATTASAHWQSTRWGMTEAEVRAIWPAAHEVEEGGHFLLRIDDPLEVGGVRYENARFIFDVKGRLREVRLEIAENYENLRERMTSQLGPPLSEDNRPMMLEDIRNKTALFRDSAKGNSVKLWSITGGRPPYKSFIYYRPIETAF